MLSRQGELAEEMLIIVDGCLQITAAGPDGRPHMMRSVLAAVSRRASRANRLIAAEQSRDALGGMMGRVYAVFSPRGGAGTTTIAINLAARLAPS